MRNNEQWLAQLFAAYSRQILAYARRRLPSDQDAEEVVVETFTTAWRRREVVPADPLPWLYATAGHSVAHMIRSSGRQARLGARLAAVEPREATPDETSRADARMDAHSAVLAGMATLEPGDAEILRLWAWEQLDSAEISVVLGCSEGAARTRLSRARQRLRAAMNHDPQEATS